MTILQFLGLLVLAVFVLALLLLLGLRYVLPWWIARKLRGVGSSFDMPMAARISLFRGALQWAQPGTDALVQAFKALGYESAGRYEVSPFPGMQIWAGAHPEARSYAVVYDHPALPPWFDVVRRNHAGVHAAVTSSPMHDPAHIPPEWNALADTSLQPQDAHQALLQLALPGEALPVMPKFFAQFYEAMHAAAADHILGGPLPTQRSLRESAERAARAMGTPMPEITPEQMDWALKMQWAQWRGAIEEAVLDHFLRSGQISAAEYERVRDTLCVVHEHMDPDDVVELALRGSTMNPPGGDIQQALGDIVNPCKRFDAVQALLPEGERLRLLGQVDKPLPARIYDASPRANFGDEE